MYSFCDACTGASEQINCLTDTIVNKISSGGLKTNSVDLDDDEDGDTDSAQDLEGSADQPLDF